MFVLYVEEKVPAESIRYVLHKERKENLNFT